MTRISIKLFSQLLHKFYSQPKLFFLIPVCGGQELRLLNQFISLGILEDFIFATSIKGFFPKKVITQLAKITLLMFIWVVKSE